MPEQVEILKYYLYYKYFLRMKDRKSLKRRQDKRIKRHLNYVAGHSRVYRGMRRLEDYPVVDKKFMMEHFHELNTVGIGRKEAEEFAVKAEKERDFVPKLRGITVGLSSGTSGRRGIFLVSDKERIRWAGYILAKFLPGRIWDKCSIAFFMRADSNLYQSVGSKRIQFHFFDIYEDFEEHRTHLEEINPQVLVGQPSVLLGIAREMEERKLRIYPEVVISIAEVLEKRDEERIKKVFGLKIIHQVYQCTEGCLATTCRCGTLHLNEDIVHIEREYLDGNRFIPVVTDFERRAQPIIRYRLNDILVEKKGRCGCGSPCIGLEKIEGREDDVFLFAGNDGTLKKVFPDFIRRCVLFAESGEELENQRRVKNAGEKGEPEKAGDSKNPGDLNKTVSDYRVVQETDGRIFVYCDLSEAGKQQVLKEFERLAQDREFKLPDVVFKGYQFEKGKKMKRVERKYKQEKDGKEIQAAGK